MQFYGEHEDSHLPLLAFWSGKMSNRNRSSTKRSSKASKQSGLLEALTRAEKRPVFVDEDEPTGTVIDLDDGDPVSEKVTIMNKFSMILIVLQCVISPE